MEKKSSLFAFSENSQPIKKPPLAKAPEGTWGVSIGLTLQVPFVTKDVSTGRFCPTEFSTKGFAVVFCVSKF